MINRKKYVDVITSRYATVEQPGVVLCLYGPRGGTVAVAELSMDEARRLCEQLCKAIPPPMPREVEYVD